MRRRSGPPAAKSAVLVVDDEPAVRRLLARILRSRGYDVFETEDAHSALALLSSTDRPMDLVVTDIVMPSMSGIRLAEQIRRAVAGCEDPVRVGLPHFRRASRLRAVVDPAPRQTVHAGSDRNQGQGAARRRGNRKTALSDITAHGLGRFTVVPRRDESRRMRLIFEQIRCGGDRNFGYLLGDREPAVGVLIDPSYSPEAFVDAPAPRASITHVINTHSHPDHTNGNEQALALTGAALAAHPLLQPTSRPGRRSAP